MTPYLITPWVSDIHSALTVGVPPECLDIWDLISEMVLQPEVADTHLWCFSSNGQYSASSAYGKLLQGNIDQYSRRNH
jgi:hypothetical protein